MGYFSVFTVSKYLKIFTFPRAPHSSPTGDAPEEEGQVPSLQHRMGSHPSFLNINYEIEVPD